MLAHSAMRGLAAPLVRHAPRALPWLLMTLTYDEKMSMVRAGLAVPGFSAEGKDAATNISGRLEGAGVFELGKQAPPPRPQQSEQRRCTREEPCDLDGSVVTNLFQVPGVILLIAFAYALGEQAFNEEDADYIQRLERQAEKSRARRLARQRDLAKSLQPLEQLFGWSLVTDDGLPTSDAYVFFAAAVLTQLLFAYALTAPLRDAFAPS